MASVKLTDKLYYGIHPFVVMPEYDVDVFIGLTEEGEKPDFLLKSNQIHKKFPIKDRTAPTLEYLKTIVDFVLLKLKNDKTVYIYCKGGHGRSGTIVASVYGKLKNLTGQQSLNHINKEWNIQRDLDKLRPKIKKLGSPQTIAQKNIVKKFLDQKNIPKKQLNYILFYDLKGKYGIFSNFFTHKNGIDIDGEKWTNSEKYFQAMKFRGKDATLRMIEYSNLIKEADSPAKVAMLGRQKKNMRFGKKWKLNKKTDERLVNDLVDEYIGLKMRSDWNEVRVNVMIRVIIHKFQQYPEIIDEIPDNTYIVENTTRDKVWGDGGDGGTGEKGTNYLGKIITTILYILKHDSCDSMSDELKKKVKIK
jgi:predicted NAD-dependent protein-ADP-ribosyltransferase YbiA (DUF1768 family)